VHALGSFLALLSSPVQDAGLPFEYISAGEVSGHVNTLFKKLFAIWSEREQGRRVKKFKQFTTHGIRNQAIEDLTDVSAVPVIATACRSGHLKQAAHSCRALGYVHGSDVKDITTARVLTNWDARRGGRCPTVACIPSDDREMFDKFVYDLFQYAPPCMKLDTDLMHSLALVLIMHFDDPWKYEDVKDCHILIIVLDKALSRVSLGVCGSEKLHSWKELALREFRMRNSGIVDEDEEVQFVTWEKFRHFALNLQDSIDSLKDDILSGQKKLENLLSSVASTMTNSRQCVSQTVGDALTRSETFVGPTQTTISSFISQSTPFNHSSNEEEVVKWISGKMEGVTLKDVFYKWYAYKIYSLEPPVDKVKTTYSWNSKAREMGQVVGIMKLFCSKGVIINEVPGNEDRLAYDSWMKYMSDLSSYLTTQVLEFYVKCFGRFKIHIHTSVIQIFKDLLKISTQHTHKPHLTSIPAQLT